MEIFVTQPRERDSVLSGFYVEISYVFRTSISEVLSLTASIRMELCL